MTDSGDSRTGARSSDMLWGFWYPALRREQVRRHKLVRAMLLDVPLVLGRDAAGKPFALRDVCPHRAFPLSFGQFDGKNVECAYHGWQFDAHTGQCQHDSFAHGRFETQMRAHLCRQLSLRGARRLHVGVHDKSRRPRPRASFRRRRPNCRHSAAVTKSRISTADLPCGVDHAIIGLMDPAHGPFVHQAWWWRSRRSIRDKEQTIRTDSQRFSHEPARALGQ